MSINPPRINKVYINTHKYVLIFIVFPAFIKIFVENVKMDIVYIMGYVIYVILKIV